MLMPDIGNYEVRFLRSSFWSTSDFYMDMNMHYLQVLFCAVGSLSPAKMYIHLLIPQSSLYEILVICKQSISLTLKMSWVAHPFV